MDILLYKRTKSIYHANKN